MYLFYPERVSYEMKKRKRPIIIKFKGSKNTLNNHAYTNHTFYLCVECVYVYVCVLRQFISIRFVDVTEMSNESQIVLYYQINDDENIYFYRNVSDVDTDISFFTFFVSVNDVSRLVLFSLISSASTKFYTLRHENRLQ